MSVQVARVGSVVDGKYEIVRPLGRGGMGEVYEARHLEISRRVALKFLRPGATADSLLVARFRNEARAAGRLQHENITAVYDTGVTNGEPYLVMEYLAGRDCARVLAADGAFDVWRAVDIVVQVCRGLALAHEQGIVHRDLKPANLFLCHRADGSELVKILDFGIAKLRSESAAADSPNTGAALGTPHYMSPEQVLGAADLDLRTDIFALGVILYELLSRRRPFHGDTPLQVLHRILTQRAQPLQALRPDLAPGLCDVVERSMAKSPDARFASAAQLADALSSFTRASSLQYAAPGPTTTLTAVDTGAVEEVPAERTADSASDQQVSLAMTGSKHVAEVRRPSWILGAAAIAVMTALIAWLSVRHEAGVAGTRLAAPTRLPGASDAAQALPSRAAPALAPSEQTEAAPKPPAAPLALDAGLRAARSDRARAELQGLRTVARLQHPERHGEPTALPAVASPTAPQAVPAPAPQTPPSSQGEHLAPNGAATRSSRLTIDHDSPYR